jgi:hypothetical protein
MKSIFASKTIWIFLILTAVSILNSFGITSLPLDQNAEWLIPVIGIVGIILRFITKEPVEW